MNYEAALQRAYDVLPDQPREAGERLSIPDPEGQTDGAFTRLTNLESIADALSRDAQHLHSSIQREFGTNGQFDGGEARYNGSFDVADFQAAIDAYVAEYVTCSECGLPDTVLKTEDGVDMLRCQACGAFRPVSKSASKNTQQQTPTLEEGETYEVKITGTGREGDGVAEKGKYTIFVSGAREGQVVNAYIESISGTLAFGRVQ
ncbi:translation initiation factor IF-2 subunit beta [Halomicroarcula sp. F13]|uniref:Translation initiation factor IF-2 subunit beta n=1 Tax=Haloarcula rubra TaxID=2487747 RepID=A0AAW4PS15_9EURY|nr:translation initiation factor IF-2 subunit beta [Halomicroarcula rubra]MBX0323927.1 translation initiation factor IF-2 subunit beta [Halomicroarcula rubra]